ncbi:MAG: hypothetical protein QOJ52_4240, partial [Acidimicrobiaceae bacterium]|nr:hypothetical protein [Acidimicrobiaceae bacterium]
PANDAGTYRWVAAYSGDPGSDAPVTTACNDPNEIVTVDATTPTLVTAASYDGAQITDTASLFAPDSNFGTAPTGTITFRIYGPGDLTCGSAAVFTSTVPVDSGYSSYFSDPFTPTVVGTYRVIATYNGDVNNNAISGDCGDPAETVSVDSLAVTLTTQASGPTTLGATFSDNAVLSGGNSPTGTMFFDVFGPDDNTGCDTSSTFSASVPVNGAGTYTSPAFRPTAPGRYNIVASYSGDANNPPVSTACDDPAETVDVARAQPTISTTASPSVPVLGNISDSATLSGAFSPTGTVTFQLFGPSDPTCTGTAVFTSAVPLGTGAVDSGPYTTAEGGVGTYHWIAAYSGDANNAPVTGACADPGESVVVTRAVPTLTAQASGDTVAGGQITDTAILNGTDPATGTITFSLFGPNDATCGATPVFTSIVPVNGDGSYTSAPFVALLAGTYRWTAAYSGDANNAPVSTPCNATGQVVTVALAPTSISTVASGPGPAISDTATLSPPGTGVPAPPTGTITFQLYLNDSECMTTPVATSMATVAGFGDYPSAPFTPTPGNYIWVASYSGDANNLPVTSSCGDPAEMVTISQAATSVTTTASPPVAVGGSIFDTAQLSGGNSPGGVITFDVFGPDDTSGCDTNPVSSSTVSVDGNGSYQSTPFTPIAPGRYDFVAHYGGDANNAAAQTSCGDAGESVTVSVPVTTTTSTSTTVSATTTTSTSTTVPATTTTSTSTTVPATTTTTSTTVPATTTTSTSTTVPATTTTSTSTTVPATTTTRPPPTTTTTTTRPPTTTTTTPPTTTTSPGTTIPGSSVSTSPPPRTVATTRPPTPTTRRIVATPVSAAAATTVPAVTTTLAPETTTSVAPPSTTTTTLAPPPPTTLPPGGPSMIARSFSDQPFSPAGAGINLAASGYPAGC